MTLNAEIIIEKDEAGIFVETEDFKWVTIKGKQVNIGGKGGGASGKAIPAYQGADAKTNKKLDAIQDMMKVYRKGDSSTDEKRAAITKARGAGVSPKEMASIQDSKGKDCTLEPKGRPKHSIWDEPSGSSGKGKVADSKPAAKKPEVKKSKPKPEAKKPEPKPEAKKLEVKKPKPKPQQKSADVPDGPRKVHELDNATGQEKEKLLAVNEAIELNKKHKEIDKKRSQANKDKNYELADKYDAEAGTIREKRKEALGRAKKNGLTADEERSMVDSNYTDAILRKEDGRTHSIYGKAETFDVSETSVAQKRFINDSDKGLLDKTLSGNITTANSEATRKKLFKEAGISDEKVAAIEKMSETWVFSSSSPDSAKLMATSNMLQGRPKDSGMNPSMKKFVKDYNPSGEDLRAADMWRKFNQGATTKILGSDEITSKRGIYGQYAASVKLASSKSGSKDILAPTNSLFSTTTKDSVVTKFKNWGGKGVTKATLSTKHDIKKELWDSYITSPKLLGKTQEEFVFLSGGTKRFTVDD